MTDNTFLWLLVASFVVHIYLSFYHDYIGNSAPLSSIMETWAEARK